MRDESGQDEFCHVAVVFVVLLSDGAEVGLELASKRVVRDGRGLDVPESGAGLCQQQLGEFPGRGPGEVLFRAKIAGDKILGYVCAVDSTGWAVCVLALSSCRACPAARLRTPCARSPPPVPCPMPGRAVCGSAAGTAAGGVSPGLLLRYLERPGPLVAVPRDVAPPACVTPGRVGAVA